MARLGQCVICGEEDPDRIWFFVTMEAKTASIHQGERFAEAHVHCRRSELAEIGRVLKCSCARCKADRGEEVQPQRDGTSQRGVRPKRHTKHFGAVAERDAWTCQICGIPIDREALPVDPFAASIDHIMRVRDGGSDDIENLRLTHRWCNLARESASWWNDDVEIADRVRVTFPRRVERLAT